MPTIKVKAVGLKQKYTNTKLNHIHHAPLIVQLGLAIPCPIKIYTIYHANDGMTIIAKLPKMWSAVIKQPIISKKKTINAETLGENISRSYSK